MLNKTQFHNASKYYLVPMKSLTKPLEEAEEDAIFVGNAKVIIELSHLLEDEQVIAQTGREFEKCLMFLDLDRAECEQLIEIASNAVKAKFDKAVKK